MNSDINEFTPQKYKLNKSASFSGSPISEKYEIKQLFKNKEGDTIIQHYTYEVTGHKKTPNQIRQFSKYTSANKSNELFPQACSDLNVKLPAIAFGVPFEHGFNFLKRVPEKFELRKADEECTPMEIDASFGSNKSPEKIDMDNSMSDVHQGCASISDITHKRKVPKLILKPNTSVSIIKTKTSERHGGVRNNILFRLFKILCWFFVPVIFGVMIMFCNSESEFIETFESKNAVDELRQLLYGQPSIIDKVESNFNIRKSNKIFIFTGGNGVGKTYTAQIIERNYPWKENIQKIIVNSQLQDTDLDTRIVNKLAKNSHNLIIIDGLVMEDAHFIIPVVERLCATDSNFILILIFNLQETTDDMTPTKNMKRKGKAISNIFRDYNIDHSLFTFEGLNAEDTKQCIRYAMKKRGIMDDDDAVNDILDTIDYKYSGCKGVYGKVALLET